MSCGVFVGCNKFVLRCVFFGCVWGFGGCETFPLVGEKSARFAVNKSPERGLNLSGS